MAQLMKNMTKEQLEEQIDMNGLEHYFMNKLDINEIADSRLKIAVLEYRMSYQLLHEILNDAEVSY